jgi:hypothetical protein
MPDRLYCTVADVIGWGSKPEAELLTFVRAASDWITGNVGDFIPVTAAKRYDGTGHLDLTVDPLLSVTSIVDDGDTLQSTDYLGYPRNKWWENGPYTRLRVDPDATTLNAWVGEEDGVVVTGTWGLYSESASTGALVKNNPLTAAGTSLVVDDGSKIRPGLVLLIATEQVLVTATGASTDSTANTAEALDASEEEIDVNDGSQVSIGEVIVIDTEQMLITDIQTNTLVVKRGWNGSTKATHANPSNVFVYRTFTVERGVNGTTAAEAVQDVAINKYVPPSDVKYLCQQMASLMSRKEDSGYAAKTKARRFGA